MRNPTEMMKQILTSPAAQKMIDYVSPVYGNSYVGLWIFQAIGAIFDPVVGYAETMRTEANPITSVLLLDMWEQHYDLPTNSSLTTEQRQARLAARIQSRGPCNPAKLASAVSAVIGDVPVRIHENVAQNTFLVEIFGEVSSIKKVTNLLDKTKPAHLIYWIRLQIETPADTMIAVSVTHSETHEHNIVCDFREETDTTVMAITALSHAEIHYLEVL